MISGKELVRIKVANPKDIIVEGLKLKINEQGVLRVAFDVTTEYPTRETFQVDKEGTRRHFRRIVVKKITNTVSHYALGQIVDGEVILDEEAEGGMREELIMGWLDDYMMEVSVWSPDSKDRDNIVDLIKLWMLELEQDIQLGNIYVDTPFLFDREIFSARFIRAYEDVNYELRKEDGPMYIGSLVYEVKSPFFHRASPDGLERYKLELIGHIVDCITAEANLQEE